MTSNLEQPPAHLRPGRPHMPGYGVLAEIEGDGLLPWAFVAERMRVARNYWVATTRQAGATTWPTGQPHVTPVWGLWHAGHFYFASGTESRKARNLKANPAVAVHLESGDEVVIIEGWARLLEDEELAAILDADYRAKYGVQLVGNPVYEVAPRKVYAWSERDFPRSATRWLTGGEVHGA